MHPLLLDAHYTSRPCEMHDVPEKDMQPIDLEKVPVDVWRALAAGRGSWRTPVLASVAPGDEADARIVVIRDVSARDRELLFYTDRRSRKCAQLGVAPAVCLIVYDSEARWQVRLYGGAQAEMRENVLDACWRGLAEAQRAHYAADLLVDAGNEKGRENFAAFRVIVNRFHCLWLTDNGNHAAEFVWHESGDDGGWRGHPVRP